MTFQPPPQRGELIWAGVDFDGTIAESVWSPSNPTSIPGRPILQNIEKLEELRDAGMKIIIHSARAWSDYEMVEAWLQYWDVPFDRIVLGKLLCAVYVDDRAVPADEASWMPRAA